MRNLYFGTRWGNAVDNPSLMVSAPIGMVCSHCDELIEAGDSGMWQAHIELDRPHAVGRPVHRECVIRSIVGSVGHQEGRCSCFGGTEEDPPGMTKREAARAAAERARGVK